MTEITLIFQDGKRSRMRLPRERARRVVYHLTHLSLPPIRVEQLSPSSIVLRVGS